MGTILGFKKCYNIGPLQRKLKRGTARQKEQATLLNGITIYFPKTYF